MPEPTPPVGYHWHNGALINSSTGEQAVILTGGNVTLSTTDIELGAVEVKNATTDDRLSISAAGAAKVDGSGVTQPVSSTQLPAALGAQGALKVEGVASGTAQPVSGTVTANLAAGTNNIGDVDVLTLPSLPAGTNNIGDVDVLTLPNVTIGAGDVDHDATNTAKVVQVGGHASPVDNPPTAVSAAGDRGRIWVDRFGATVVRRRKIRESYTAVFRLAETTARLDQTFTHTANTNKQWATLHHAASATKELQLQRVIVWITSDTTAAFQGIIELRELSSATPPATGNPAITGRPHRIGTSAHEATALYLPTTAGSEASVNQPVSALFFDWGVEGAVSTVNPISGTDQGPAAFTLYDASKMDDQVIAPTAPVGVYGGWAVVSRLTTAAVVRMTCMMTFTEEIP